MRSAFVVHQPDLLRVCRFRRAEPADDVALPEHTDLVWVCVARGLAGNVERHGAGCDDVAAEEDAGGEL